MQLRAVFSDLEGIAFVARQSLAKRVALFGVLDRLVQRLLGRAYAGQGNDCAVVVKGLHGLRKAAGAGAELMIARHAHVIEKQRAATGQLAAHAVVGATRDTCGV